MAVLCKLHLTCECIFIKELESFFYAGGNGMSLEKIKNDEYLVCTVYFIKSS